MAKEKAGSIGATATRPVRFVFFSGAVRTMSLSSDDVLDAMIIRNKDRWFVRDISARCDDDAIVFRQVPEYIEME